MYRLAPYLRLSLALGVLFFATSAAAAPAYYTSSASGSNGQAQPPADCEMGVQAQMKDCSRGMDPRQSFYKTDSACAAGRIGISAYTAEMSIFNDSSCTGGPCDNSKPGIAHRVWPLGSKVEVCDLRTKICAVAVVMDRGPNVCLVRRTIDANPALKTALHMTGGLDPATYRLLSVPGVAQTAEPSGPTAASLEAIQAAARMSNQYGGLPAMNYSTINTPWGVGYLGSPVGNAGAVPVGYPTGGGAGQVMTQDTYCVISIDPVIVYPVPAGTPFPPNCYNSPPAGTAMTQRPLPPPQSSAMNQNQTPVNQQTPQPTTSGNQSTSTTAVIPPQALLIAQPARVKLGNTLLVSWSSVGMSGQTPCQVSEEDQSLAQTNTGSQIIQTKSLQTGTLSFTLSCTTQAGAQVQQSASVTII